MKSEVVQKAWWARIPTSEGEFLACYSARGLCELRFPPRPGEMRDISVEEELPADVRGWHELTQGALLSALAGEPPMKLPPLDLSCGSSFQRAVWAAMRQVPWGQTISYGALAEAIQRPGASRAVGAACGANPVPVLVPCHRVVAAGQRLGGFSGGLDWKRRLLGLERQGVGSGVRTSLP